MVPEVLKRFAKLSTAKSGGGEPLGEQRPGSENRRLGGRTRGPLPSAWVRMYVWRRDHGKCVQCGSQERVWFDYLTPVWEGGSITQQNVRLLCASCRQDMSESRRRKKRRA